MGWNLGLNLGLDLGLNLGLNLCLDLDLHLAPNLGSNLQCTTKAATRKPGKLGGLHGVAVAHLAPLVVHANAAAQRVNELLDACCLLNY